MPRAPKVGRTTHEIEDHPWPVVTRTMLGDGEALKTPDGWNELVKALIAGRIHLKNAELAARKAYLNAHRHVTDREKADALESALKAQIEWIMVAQKEWPLTVVG